MTTKVIFRVDERENQKEVIAIFPEMAGNNNPWLSCGGYVHVGQHITLTTYIMDFTRPATPEEYKELYAELVSIGYDDLKIAKRMTRKDLAARKAQIF